MIWFLDDENRAPKMNIGARQAGINKHKKPSSMTKGDNKGKPPRFRAACYECPAEGGYTPYVYIERKARKAICKNGHVIDLYIGCKSGK